jgi:hypothetical protein
MLEASACFRLTTFVSSSPTLRKRGRPPVADTQTKVSRRRSMKKKIGLNMSILENSEGIQEEPCENARAIITHTRISEIPNINIVGNDEKSRK